MIADPSDDDIVPVWVREPEEERFRVRAAVAWMLSRAGWTWARVADGFGVRRSTAADRFNWLPIGDLYRRRRPRARRSAA